MWVISPLVRQQGLGPKRLKAEPIMGKAVVMGLLDRHNGEIRAFVVPSAHKRHLVGKIYENVELGALILSNENQTYNIDELLGGRTYRERTTLRGVLETLTVRDDGQLFFIRDRVRGRNVRCIIDSVEVLERAKQALGSRVSVWGMARFNKLGLPISIKVEDFRVLPKDSPRFDEVPGIDLTGGMDAAEYVRRLRDGE